MAVNKDTLKGKWKQAKGKVREKWGKLTDDDLEYIAGQRDQLVGKIQEAYGKSREEARREVDEFEHSLESESESRRSRA